jgi:hypothetical protein
MFFSHFFPYPSFFLPLWLHFFTLL